MTKKHAIFSVHCAPPTPEDIREGLRLALDLQAQSERRSKRHRELPQTWVIGANPAKGAADELAARPRGGWPAGFHFGPPALPVHLVSLRELPVSPDTLVLRLLGTGDVLERALAEQAALPADSPVRCAAEAALRAVCPAEGEPVPIEDATKDPVLRACRRAYRRWAK
jgi:hypothetical protein